LGADHVIDYKQQDFTRNGQQYDLILDVQAYHSIIDYKRALSANGIYVMVGGSSVLVGQLLLLGPLISITGSKKLSLLMHKPDANDLDTMKTFFTAGKTEPVIDKCYPLSEVAKAFRYYEEGHVEGKVVITVMEGS
jgi:NADPH:quinone reductase-like Zn-dependent oxidoreductase